MVKKTKFITSTCLLALLWACAQVVAPTGGERDMIPPVVLSLEPENQSLNFSSNKFTLEFDEYVVLRNLKEQLLVSPPLKYNLETKIKGKQLIFTIKDTLKENTTYVFNFGKSIVDLNEGNPLPNFQYVFSTGPVIDSLTLSGKVVDAFELTAEKDAVLLLYAFDSEDSAVSNQLPIYVSRTDENGVFNFTNLADGEYKLFSLVDKNDNYKYDRLDEKFGFLDSTVRPRDTLSNIKLFGFTLPEEKQFIEKQEVFENHLELTFKVNPKNVDLYLIDTTIENFVQFVEYDEKKIKIWHKESSAKKLKMGVELINFTDTIKFTPKVLNDSLKLELITELSGKQNFFEPLSFEFNRPLKKINKELISLLDSDSNSVQFSLEFDTTDIRKALIKPKKLEYVNLLLTILPNAFEDINGRVTDTISTLLFFNTAEDFGNLTVKIKEFHTEHPILQLTNSSGKVLKEYFTIDTAYSFKHLPAANYGLKLISDENQNKKWEAGNYYENKLPEGVIIYDEIINIRQNWDKEIIWIIEP